MLLFRYFLLPVPTLYTGHSASEIPPGSTKADATRLHYYGTSLYSSTTYYYVVCTLLYVVWTVSTAPTSPCKPLALSNLLTLWSRTLTSAVRQHLYYHICNVLAKVVHCESVTVTVLLFLWSLLHVSCHRYIKKRHRHSTQEGCDERT